MCVLSQAVTLKWTNTATQIYNKDANFASLTNSAVFSIVASASAVTLVAVCTKSHTHSWVLARVVTTGIHCKQKKKCHVTSHTTTHHFNVSHLKIKSCGGLKVKESHYFTLPQLPPLRAPWVRLLTHLSPNRSDWPPFVAMSQLNIPEWIKIWRSVLHLTFLHRIQEMDY